MTDEQFQQMMNELKKQSDSLANVEASLKLLGEAEAAIAAQQQAMIDHLTGRKSRTDRGGLVDYWRETGGPLIGEERNPDASQELSQAEISGIVSGSRGPSSTVG